MNLVGIDTEYIAATAVQGEIPGPRPNPESVYCEVMQIGACKLDGEGREIEVLNLTVQAHRIPTIPQWLIRMTGMTEEKRAKGIPFPEALEKLVAFLEDERDVWTFGGDWHVLQANIRAHGLTSPSITPFQRLKPYLENYGLDFERFKRAGLSEVSSGGLYKVLGIHLPLIEGVGIHDAVHDARSLIHSIYHLKTERGD